MNFDEFIEQVQSRGELPSLGDTVKSVRAVLETLGERLPLQDVKDLAAQLPAEIAYYLRQRSAFLEKFDLNGFYSRVSRREPAGLSDAVQHARVVLSVLNDAVSEDEMQHIRAQLPRDFAVLFPAPLQRQLKKAA